MKSALRFLQLHEKETTPGKSERRWHQVGREHGARSDNGMVLCSGGTAAGIGMVDGKAPLTTDGTQYIRFVKGAQAWITFAYHSSATALDA